MACSAAMSRRNDVRRPVKPFAGGREGATGETNFALSALCRSYIIAAHCGRVGLPLALIAGT
ncbi:hypothetical protein KCP78_09975 [Salmonella enterica subsp. enterica]|nr:hypothetical protein KCP78_09975 [Salmonella enterica subsp. enterica]